MKQTGGHQNQLINPQPVPVESSEVSPHMQQKILNMNSIGGSNIFPGAADIKSKIKAEFGLMFGTDTDFVISKTYSTIAQGFRFRMDRNKAAIRTTFIPISKKGGLLKPGLLHSNGKVKGEIMIQNTLTGKPAITMHENVNLRTWTVINNEANNVTLGTIKATQTGENILLVFNWNSTELCSVSFKCPLRKSGICSSPKPATLYNINFSGKFKSPINFEENPNGDECKDNLEINAYYSAGQTPELLEFVALISLWQAMAAELY